MFSKYIVPAICATNLLSGVEAARRHRHLHKKDVVYAATEIDIVTDYVTVTVYAGKEASTTATTSATTSAASTTVSTVFAPTATTTVSLSSVAQSSASSVVIASTPVEQHAAASPTTLSTAAKAKSADNAIPATNINVQNVATTSTTATAVYVATPATTAVAAATTAASSSSSGVKRGLAYNDVALVDTIVGLASSKFSWAYNWGFDSSGLSGLPFIPMLWGPTHYSSDWDTKAKAAITSNAGAILSFNECDNAGQCNLGPADAAKYHKQYLNPYDGQIRIGAPSISSSEEANQGLDWLSQWKTACNGACAFDFCNIHWYGPGGVDGANEFLGHLVNAQATCGKNIWVTEFASISGDADAFMQHALEQLDNNSTFTFVEKYSYFYVSTGSLFDTTAALSSFGKIYATQ